MPSPPHNGLAGAPRLAHVRLRAHADAFYRLDKVGESAQPYLKVKLTAEEGDRSCEAMLW